MIRKFVKAHKTLSFLLTFSAFFVFSTQITQAQTTQVPETEGPENITLSENEVVDEDYFSAGETVTLDGTVNGDAYIAAGNVYINGTINGDLLTAGGNVTVRGNVSGNIRAAGGNILISGEVGENVTTVGGNVTLSDSANVAGSLTAAAGTLQVYAPVGRGMTLGVGQATLSNSVDGNITAGVGTLDMQSGTNVTGNLTYWSEQEASIASGATISGELTHNLPPQNLREDQEENISQALTAAGVTWKIFTAISAFIVGLILLKIAPLFITRTTSTINNAFWKSMLFGLLVLFLTPLVVILLLITLLGLPLALILGALYFISLYFSKIIVSFALGSKLFTFADRPKIARAWSLLLGIVILYAVDLLPIVGWIASFLALLVGLGALVIAKKELYTHLRSKKII